MSTIIHYPVSNAKKKNKLNKKESVLSLSHPLFKAFLLLLLFLKLFLKLLLLLFLIMTYCFLFCCSKECMNVCVCVKIKILFDV